MGFFDREHEEEDSEEDPVEAPKTLVSVTEVAQEVIKGNWGTGQERRVRLAKAGYNPNAVQKEVVRITNKL